MPLDALRVADDIPTVIREALEARYAEARAVHGGGAAHHQRGRYQRILHERNRATDAAKRECPAQWAFNLRLTGQQALLLLSVIEAAHSRENGVGAGGLQDRSRGRRQTLVNRYAEQLAWYARALAEITGKPVRSDTCMRCAWRRLPCRR